MSDVPYGPAQLPWSSQVPEGASVKGPIDNPVAVYPSIPPTDVADSSLPRIDYKLFEIPPGALTGPQRANAYASLVDYLGTQVSRFSGFQANQDQSYAARLSWLLDMHANNIGDPYAQGDYTLNSKFCERAVIDTFAALWNVDWPNRYDVAVEEGESPKRKYPERCWGYVLTMGCTEANYYGLFNARDYLKGRQLLEEPTAEGGGGAQPPGLIYGDPKSGDENPNQYRPIIFYSEDTHYSIIKAVRVLELTTFYAEGQRRYPGQCPITADGSWPQEVPSHNENGSPDSGTVRVDQLEKLVRFFVERGHPPLIVANMGTTWKGAYDDVPAINAMLQELGKEFPWLWEREICYAPGQTDVRRGFWLHVDGALGAPYLPFLEMAFNRGLLDKRGPIFDFRNEAVMSIGCSMHKWIGGPWPSGVYMTRTKYQLEPPDTVGYLGSADTTFGGSRSAFSPLILWDYFSRMSYEDNMRKALETEAVAAYTETRLRELEAGLKEKFGPEVDLWIARSDLSLAVRFRQANATLCYKWTLDTETLDVPVSATVTEQQSYSHIFVMQSVTKERVDEFIADVWEAAKDGWHNAFPAEINGVPNPSPVEPPSTTGEGAEHHRVFVPLRGRGWS
jgi:histidine decarboxylase